METLFKESYTDIVFEKRNKDFGAYSLRKRYAKMVIFAFLFSIVIFSLALASPIIYSLFEKEKATDETISVVANVMNVEEIEQPKEEVKKIETPKESIKFPPPEITPDEKVTKEEELATEEDLKKSNPGSETTEGEKGRSSEESGAKPEEKPVTEPVKIEDNSVVEWAEQMAEFPDGEQALRDYLREKTVYPQEAKNLNITGTAYVEFIVNKDGSLSDFKIAKSSGNALLDEAALSAAKTLPKFKPASMNGELKRTRKKVKFPFILK